MTKTSKKITIIVSAMIALTVTFLACRKAENILSNVSSGGDVLYAIAPNGSEPIYVENQLRWIARVLPVLAKKVPNFKTSVHNSISASSTKQRYNAELQVTLAGTTVGINFSNAVNTTVDTIFSGNDYDSAYFFSFEFEECINRTLIRFNKEETSTTMTTKPLVVVPYYEGVRDTMTGYYYDSLNNRLDSLLVHEHNADNYYLWIVDADNMCLEGAANGAPFTPESHCGDGTCQSWYGETPANCPGDCGSSQPSGSYTLILKSIRHDFDKNHAYTSAPPAPNDAQQKGYHESYFSGKYDVFYSYALIKVTDGFSLPFMKDAWFLSSLVKISLGRDKYTDNHGHTTRKWTDFILKRLKKSNDDVIREKDDGGGGTVKSSSNTPNTIAIDKILSFNYIPNTDKVYVDMCEFDRAKSLQLDNTSHVDGGVGSVTWDFGYRQETHFKGSINDPDMYQNCPYFYGFIPHVPAFAPGNTGFWQDGTALFGPGSYFIDISDVNGNAAFQDLLVGNKNIGTGLGTVDLNNSEMIMRYVIMPNP